MRSIGDISGFDDTSLTNPPHSHLLDVLVLTLSHVLLLLTQTLAKILLLLNLALVGLPKKFRLVYLNALNLKTSSILIVSPQRLLLLVGIAAAVRLQLGVHALLALLLELDHGAQVVEARLLRSNLLAVRAHVLEENFVRKLAVVDITGYML